MRNKAILLSLILFVFAAPLVSAQTASTTDSAKLRLLKERLITQKENREDLKTLLQAKKLAMSTVTQTKREEFKAKLATLKDQRKKIIVERVDLKLSTINQNATNRLTLAIEKLEKLLDKFSERASTAKTEGKDTTEVETAIAAAEAAIASAKGVVATQAAKEYTAQIINEPTLKNTVGQAVSSLRHDLKTTFDVVKNAKQKVMDVARALAKLNSEDATPTPSTIVTPSLTVEPTI